jgi:hypothetical protein
MTQSAELYAASTRKSFLRRRFCGSGQIFANSPVSSWKAIRRSKRLVQASCLLKSANSSLLWPVRFGQSTASSEGEKMGIALVERRVFQDQEHVRPYPETLVIGHRALSR